MTVVSLKQAYTELYSLKTPPTLAIIDYRLPGYEQKQLFNGGDIAKLTRSLFPDCKIFIVTAQTEALIIYDILKKIHPDGLAIKSDIQADTFIDNVNTVLHGNLYYSAAVKACTQKIWQDKNFIDDDNRKIIFFLSKGYKVKDLESVVHLSLSTIQKRIIAMKKAIGINADSSLVAELSLRGFI